MAMTLDRVQLLAAFFVASFLTALALIPLVRFLARRVGLVDKPDGRRKLHERAIPVAGGLAVFVSGLLVLFVGLLSSSFASEVFDAQRLGLIGLLLGTIVICLVGVADDARGLRGRVKLLGQIAAAGLVVAFGVRVDAIYLFGFRLEMGAMAVPFTIFWLLGAINSLNLIDGMDGLLGSIGTIVCLAIAILAGTHGYWAEAIVAATLAGALVGFLRYNLPPATIFLGDAGSMLIGLVIGVLAIRSSLKGPATVALGAPLALLIIPIFDTTAAILRRKLTGRSIYSTDRGHLHHCLLRKGLSRPTALLVVSSLCLISVIGVLASTAYQNEAMALLSALTVVAILTLTRLFGHAELMLVLQSAGAMARSLAGGSSEAGHRVEVRLQGSVDWSDLWSRLLLCAERMNLRGIVFDVNAPAVQEGYHARWFRAGRGPTNEEPEVWSADLPLTVAGRSVGRIVLNGYRDGEAVWRKVAAFAEIAEQIEAVLENGATRREPVPQPLPVVAE